MKYMLRIVLTPLCFKGKLDERLFPFDDVILSYDVKEGYVRVDTNEDIGRLLFFAPMDSIAYMERIEVEA